MTAVVAALSYPQEISFNLAKPSLSLLPPLTLNLPFLLIKPRAHATLRV